MAESLRICLASASPRRAGILRALGVGFSVLPSDFDERRLVDERPGEMVVRLAIGKAGAIDPPPDSVVIGADTAVVLGERVFGKPASMDEAVGMLLALSGQTHEVLTGVAVAHHGRVDTALSRTEVRFRDIDPAEASDYWHSGEPRDKAGAYAVQGLGGVFVEAINGSYTGVVGLPVFETARLLQKAGIDILGV